MNAHKLLDNYNITELHKYVKFKQWKSCDTYCKVQLISYILDEYIEDSKTLFFETMCDICFDTVHTYKCMTCTYKLCCKCYQSMMLPTCPQCRRKMIYMEIELILQDYLDYKQIDLYKYCVLALRYLVSVLEFIFVFICLSFCILTFIFMIAFNAS